MGAAQPQGGSYCQEPAAAIGDNSSSDGADLFHMDTPAAPMSPVQALRSWEVAEAEPETPQGALAAWAFGEEAGYRVKNGFIDLPSPVHEEFSRLRRVNSSPPALMQELRASSDPFGLLNESMLRGGIVAEGEAVSSDLAEGLSPGKLEPVGRCAPADFEEPGSASDFGESTMAGTASGETFADRISDGGDGGSGTGSAVVIGLADSIAAVDANAQVLPSRGSALHEFGTCKPCAFVGDSVCRNGANCQFCHLCKPGEKKRRRKEWMEMKRQVRREAAMGVHCGTWPHRGLVAQAPHGVFYEPQLAQALFAQPIVVVLQQEQMPFGAR